MATGNPGILESLKALKSIPSEAKSAGAGLAATQSMVNQATQAPLVPTHVLYSPTPQDLLHSQGPYGSRPGEQRLDSKGDPIVSGLSGVKRK